MGTQDKVINKKVSELFDYYFARKTCATILQDIGFTNEQIINITEHADPKTLRYYKGGNDYQPEREIAWGEIKDYMVNRNLGLSSSG